MSKGRRSSDLKPLTVPLIDSHCHVAAHVYGEDLEMVIERARKAGLSRMVNIGAGHGMKGNEEVLKVHARFPFMHPTIGLHPHDASLLEADPTLLSRLHELALSPGVVAYGEIGLDAFYHFSPMDTQERAFRVQLELAETLGLPIVLHVRDAHEAALRILKEVGVTVPRVFHCFSSGWEVAELCLEIGAYLSLPGIVTFPKAPELREVAARMPLERLLIETDSPYLAPVPFRGKRNEPAFVQEVARQVAIERNISIEEVAEKTALTAHAFFRLPELS